MRILLSRFCLFIFLIGFTSGCVSVSTTHPQGSPPQGVSTTLPVQKKGVYHKVKAGETIWHIAQAYGVPLDEIIRSNRIPNVAYIEPDQLIFIPGGSSDKEVVLAKSPVNGTGEFAWPVKGKVISYFGQWKNSYVNRGIDIEIKDNEKISAARDGKVVFADYLNGYSYTVILDHGDGYFTTYAQNSSLLVKVGEQVKKGLAIAESGKNGNLAYLHFEVRKNSVADNPLYYLP